MALDDHGLGISVPDEHTIGEEMYVIVRDAINKLAGLIAAGPAELPALTALGRKVAALELAAQATPQPAPAVDLEPLQIQLAEQLRLIEQLQQAPAPEPVLPEDARKAIADLKLEVANLKRNEP